MLSADLCMHAGRSVSSFVHAEQAVLHYRRCLRLWLAAGHEHLRQVCNVQVKLCDLASGAFTHSLVGHREAIWALHWSLTSEWHLFTSAADGQVRRT